ncbi:TLR adapter interacting with SLC15A4 on the lysosome [Pseudophryne corroboree]|uniref:TLR adapter interacting with SLC15A4 on the lysosome n=1 Tax=Pseudophryne corroboree TaxID=495146 RepID=UPI0030813AE6
MLSEGYLYKIQLWYEDDISMLHQKKVTEGSKELSGICTLNYSSAHETRSRRVFKKFGSVDQRKCESQPQESALGIMQRQIGQDEAEGSRCESEKSPSASINGNSPSNKETYLVPPSCKNICRDYNDLHIAGDQVMAMNSVLSDFTCNSSFDYCEGPFLQSSQIPPTMDSLCVTTNDQPKKPTKRDSWKVASMKDKSIINPEQPLSNSILNEYLERKVIELYKQYMMDISCSASSAHIMNSELIMNNVQQISVQISREQNMETNKAKDMVISYLLRLASEKQSNVISTPDLQISSNLT